MLVSFLHPPNSPSQEPPHFSHEFSEIRSCIQHDNLQCLGPSLAHNRDSVNICHAEINCKTTSRYTCREAECLNCRNNLQEGKEERMSFAGDGEESTEQNRKYRLGNTTGGGNGREAAQPALKGLGIRGKDFGFSQAVIWVCVSKALMTLLHLSIEQVGSGLHYVHQNSHWTPAKFVSQRIV